MKNKSPLMLIELTVMLLILAASAALCLRGFVWADARAQETQRRDLALVQLQNAAEVLQACGGDWEEAVRTHGGTWEAGHWVISLEDGTVLRAVPEETELPTLGAARLVAEYEDQQLLTLQVCWQEVGNEE